jgi:hypothetical protein
MRSQQLLYIQAISHQASVTSAMREGKKIAQYSHQDREQVISKNPAKDEFDETQGTIPTFDWIPRAQLCHVSAHFG